MSAVRGTPSQTLQKLQGARFLVHREFCIFSSIKSHVIMQKTAPPPSTHLTFVSLRKRAKYVTVPARDSHIDFYVLFILLMFLRRPCAKRRPATGCTQIGTAPNTHIRLLKCSRPPLQHQPGVQSAKRPRQLCTYTRIPTQNSSDVNGRSSDVH